MPTLSDREIKELISTKKLIITPLIADNIQPGSIDLTLGNEIDILQVHASTTVDLTKDCKDLNTHTEKKDISSGFELLPGQTVTGHSAEYIEMPRDVNGFILNRNSLARIGLDAGLSQYINPDYKGHKIIQIRNNASFPIKLMPGIRICTLVLLKMGDTSDRSFDERHNTESLTGFIEKLRKSHQDVETAKSLDKSFSDFMNRRIQELAQGR